MPTEVIQFQDIDKLGLYVDTPSIALPPGAFSDCLNVRFDDGSIEKVRGYTEIFETLSLTNIQYITYWPNPNGAVWIVVNRQLTNVNNQMIDRDFIYGIRIESSAVVSTNLSDSLSTGYVISNQWQSTIFNGGYSIIMNPGNTTPEHATDTQGSTTLPKFAGLPNWEGYDNADGERIGTVTAGIVVAFGNVLLAGDLRETRTVMEQGTPVTRVRDLRGVVRSSSVAAPGSIPNNWNPFLPGAGTADEIIVADTGRITAMVPLQGRMMVYTANSITQVSVSAAGLSEVNITGEYGALSVGTVFEFDGRHIVLGSNDIYAFEGHPSSIQSISDGKIRRNYYDSVHSSSTDRTVIVRNQTWDELWICYRSSSNAEDNFDRALTWNYRNNTWSRRTLPNLQTVAVGPITGGGAFSTEYTIAGGPGGISFAGINEIQTFTISGTRSNVVPDLQRSRITLPSNFNSGIAPFSSNASTQNSSASVDIGNGIFIDVDSSHTYSDREQFVLAPSTLSTVPNPETYSFSPGDGQFRVWGGNLEAYRVFTTSGGTAGTRITGGSSNRFPSGFAIFDEGALVQTPTLSAGNIPNPIALPVRSSVGGVTTTTSQLPTYIIGIQQSTNTAIRTAIVHGRGRNPAWSGESASSFSQRLYLLNSGATNIRAVIFGNTVSYTGRRARLRNTNNYAVSITGSWGSITVAANSSTSYITFNSTTAAWNVTVTPPAVVYSFDPDTSDTIYINAITNRSLTHSQNAEQTLTTIGNAIAALDSGITFDGVVGTDGSNRFITIEYGEHLSLSHMLIVIPNSGSNVNFVLTETDTTGSRLGSVYNITSPEGTVMLEVTGSVGASNLSDLTTVQNNIVTAINTSNAGWTAAVSGSTLSITSNNPGQINGDWTITVSNTATTNTDPITFTAGTKTEGADVSLPGNATVVITDPNSSIIRTVNFPDNATPAQAALALHNFFNSLSEFNSIHTSGTAVFRVEALELGRDAPSFTLTLDGGTIRNGLGTTPQPDFTFTTSGVEATDAERPWSTVFINEGINFVVGARAGSDNTFAAIDVSGGAFGEPLQSYVERKNIHVQPTKETEMITAMYLDTEGTREDAGAFTIRIQTSNAAGKAPTINLTGTSVDPVIYEFRYNDNPDNADQRADYKTDVRLTGRIMNYRIEDNSTNSWSIAAMGIEVGQGGTR